MWSAPNLLTVTSAALRLAKSGAPKLLLNVTADEPPPSQTQDVDRVCRTDDAKHIGVVIGMFKSAKYGGWTANICWKETNWREYISMALLVHVSGRLIGGG
jgi:hypothetical protein